MFKNYLKVAIRNLLKNKAFTGITLLGLSVGMACFILLFLFVRHEWSFDRFHENESRIFRVLTRFMMPHGSDESYEDASFLPRDSVGEFASNYPTIKRVTRFQNADWNWLEYGEKTKKDSVGFADPDFLKMFSFPLVAGDIETALSQPDGILISEDLAEFFFGELGGDYTQVLGEVISIPASNKKDFLVTGVLKNLPDNSIFNINALTQHDNLGSLVGSNNGWGTCQIFVELRDNAGIEDLQNSITRFYQTLFARQITGHVNMGQISRDESPVRCVLQPLKDIYLNPEVQADYTRQGNYTTSFILSGLATLILLISCINAVTIQLGQAVVRSREVGIRKVVGANRFQLMFQFFIEAGILCSTALVFSVLLAELLLPHFNNLSYKNLELSLLSSPDMLLFLFIALSGTTFVIGGFPSIIMTRFSPLVILRFQKATQGRGLFTSSLVVGQFAITILLIFCTIVMQQQLHYVINKSVGYQKEGVLILNLPSEINNERRTVMKQRLKALSSLSHVSGSDRNFASGSNGGDVENRHGEFFNVRSLTIDENYFDTLNIELKEGHNFTPELTSSRNRTVIINETMAKLFDWEQPIGENFTYWGRDQQVIGVVKDFHIDSMRREIEPLIMHRWNFSNPVRYLYLRYKEGRLEEARGEIERVWKSMEPHKPIDLRFLDEILENQYDADKRSESMIRTASVIAVILSCMGLWGITSIAVARRTKEIGIRKVMGSSEFGILNLFANDMAKLFCLSLFVAVPIAYKVMQSYLQLFSYRIEIPWFVFFYAGSFCVAIAFVTVSWLVIRAALNNPVEALRYE